MSLIQELSILAVRQVLAERADSVLGFLGKHFNDHSRRLEQALRTANERAWRALELALAGSSWWTRCTSLLRAREDRVFAEQVRAFLDGQAARLPIDDRFRSRCLADLRAARQEGLIPGTEVRLASLSDRNLTRYHEQTPLVEHELSGVAGMASVLERAGYADLAKCVALRGEDSPPLLVLAVGYFFRRALETDPELAASLNREQLQRLDAAQEAGFHQLHQALAERGDQLVELLAGVQGVVLETRDEVRAVRGQLDQLGRVLERNATPALEVASETRDKVRLLQKQLAQQSQEIRQLSQTILRLLQPRPEEPSALPQPQVPVPALPDPAVDTWEGVRQLLARCTAAPAERRQSPELQQAVGQLQAAASNFAATRRTYLELCQPASGPVLPVYPPEEVDAFHAVSAEATLRRIEGPLISSVFLQSTSQAPVQQPAQPSCAEPAARPRLLSDLFAAPPGNSNIGQGSNQHQDPENSTPPAKENKRSRLLSPLFQPEGGNPSSDE